MRNWHRISLILPLGVALAAVYVPLRLSLAGIPLPMAVQAAVEAPARQTAHFFPGDVRLSGFQRLIMPEGSMPGVDPLQPEAEIVPPVSQANFQAPAPSPSVAAAEPQVLPLLWEAEPASSTSPHYFATKFCLSIEPQEVESPAKRMAPAEVQAAAAPKLVEAPNFAEVARVANALRLAIAPQVAEVPQVVETLSAEPAKAAVEPAARKVVFDDQVRAGPHYFPSVGAGVSNLRMASFLQPAEPQKPAAKPVEAEAAVVAKAEPPMTQVAVAKQPEPAAKEPAAPQIPMIKWDEQVLRNPHYFVGSMRLASLDRKTALAAPPLQQVAVAPALPPELPPAPVPPTQPIPVAPQLAAAPQPEQPRSEFVLPSEPLAGSATSRLQATAVAAIVQHQPLLQAKPQLASLIPAGQSRPVPLMAAEVLPAARPAPSREEFQLTSLQLQPGVPDASLQPTEVVPIPTPTNPALSRNPGLDADRPIGALTTKVATPAGKLPTDLAVNQFRGEYPAYLPRGWEDTVYFWDAPSMCIGPLRYEEVNLERYGYSHCVAIQPVLSGMHFLGSTLALPYSMTVRHPGSCVYPLGHYRPGSPAPYRHIWPEARPVAASMECLTIAGLILLIP